MAVGVAQGVRTAALTVALVLGCAPGSNPAPGPAPDSPGPRVEGKRNPGPGVTNAPSGPDPAPPPVARSPVALEGGEWVVVELEGSAPLEGSRISLEFADGQVSGEASCNRYAAEWARSAPDRIRIGEARATLRACAPALMDQERRFLELLGRFESVRITPGDELVLETGTGEELRATRG